MLNGANNWEGHKGERDESYLFQVVSVRPGQNTDGRLGWIGLYRRQLHPQQCRGHPGLLHLQCTAKKKENRTRGALEGGVHIRPAECCQFEKRCCSCNQDLRSLWQSTSSESIINYTKFLSVEAHTSCLIRKRHTQVVS